MSEYRYVHHNKCHGGRAIEEVNGKVYCYGRIECGYDDIVYMSECEQCPRFIRRFEEEIENES